MADERLGQLTPLQRASLLVEKMQARIDRLEAERVEPIAVVGIGCRYPGGANDADSFWELVRAGVDAIGPVPPDRWDGPALRDPNPLAPGKMVSDQGGFLPGIALFDRRFFGISPRRAAAMDPQQRLLLEVAWEALEHAGIPQATFAGSRTGVFVGATTLDYGELHLADPDRIDDLSVEGLTLGVLSNRISHQLDLRGPSVTLDAACASSLVALHLACRSLRARESDLALAAGVNLMLSPLLTVALSQAGLLSADGRCRTLDADASGFVRSEGCGVLVLERQSDARAAGHQILGLVRGTAVNHDGGSGSFKAPNRPSQQAAIRSALADAGVAPAAIGYVELHGTGTPLGDATEIEALTAVLAEGREPGRVCTLGSVKTNFGHTEAAAGMAGVIKALLSMREGALPPLVHFRAMNPEIRLDPARFAVAPRGAAWEGGPRYAGVSAFGYTGTNAHVVLAEAPPAADAPAATAPQGAQLLPLSARGESALRALAAAYRERLLDGSVDPGALAAAAARWRTHHPHRLAVVGRGGRGLADALALYLEGGSGSHVHAGVVDAGGAPHIAYLLPEESTDGVDHAHPSEELSAEEPSFACAFRACRAALADLDPRVIAAVSFQVGVGALWRSWGIEPSAVVGGGRGALALSFLSAEPDLASMAARLRAADERAPADPQDLEVAVHQLLADGYGAVLMIGAAPGTRHAFGAGPAAPVMRSASPGPGETRQRLLEALAALYVRGAPIDWERVHTVPPAPAAALPRYPWQRERAWLDGR